MGHRLQAIILSGAFNRAKAEVFGLKSVSLPQGLELLFLTAESCDLWAEKLSIVGFRSLHPKLDAELVHHMLAEIAPGSRFAIIETDYFGGYGEQYAVVYEQDQCLMSEGRINEALTLLGVVPEAGLDAFDTVGLGHYRRVPEAFADDSY